MDLTEHDQKTESLRIFGKNVRVRHRSPELHDLVMAVFDRLCATDDDAVPDLDYSVEVAGQSYAVSKHGQLLRTVTGLGNLLYLLEKDITVEVQTKRTDLLFLHAAAVEWNGRAYVLAADSGKGKSTTTWGLLHHGFAYLSDELSPVDFGTMRVLPYPRALSLKAQMPSPYPLPPPAIHLGRAIYVPSSALPSRAVLESCPLAGIFLLHYSPESSAPSIRLVTAGEGAARLYVTALNALAHEEAGLAPIIKIASHVPCFALSSAGLLETCNLVRNTIERMESHAASNSRR